MTHQQSKSKISAVAFAAAVNILKKWGCTEKQIIRILDIPALRFSRYLANSSNAELTSDQLTKISYLLNIHAVLRTVFTNQDNVASFMACKNSNDYFDNRSPIEIIESNSSRDLHQVAMRIEALFFLQ